MQDIKKFQTYNKYIVVDHEKKQKKLNVYLLNVFRFINRILNIFNLKVVNFQSTFIKPEQRNSTSKKYINLRNQNLSKYLEDKFLHSLPDLTSGVIREYITEFDLHFTNLPIKNLRGGMGYNNSLLLFILTKHYNPDNIIESGVWRGNTTYFLDKASSEKTQIDCFDINFSNLIYKSNKANYYENDLTYTKKNYSNKKIFALFDDHTPHYERLLWSIENNISFVVLDDDLSPYNLHSDGLPPVPTGNMIFNYLSVPKEFEWYHQNNKFEYDIKNLSKIELIQKSFQYNIFPSIDKFTGYKNSSYSSFLMKA